MQSLFHYPKTPPRVGTIILTSYGVFAHENEIPKARAVDAIKMAEQIAGEYDEDSHHLGALMLLLSDVPVDPLLKASAAQKGSVMGLASLGYLISRDSAGVKACRILKEGGGVFLVKLSGTHDKPAVDTLLFSTWQEYQTFLTPILRDGNFEAGKGSSFS
jgi:hypothetical protein